MIEMILTSGTLGRKPLRGSHGQSASHARSGKGCHTPVHPRMTRDQKKSECLPMGCSTVWGRAQGSPFVQGFREVPYLRGLLRDEQ